MLQGNRSPIGLPQSECQRQFRFRTGLHFTRQPWARACIKSLRSWLSVSPSMGKRSAPGLSSCFGWLPVCHRVHRRGAGVLPAGQTSTTVIPAAAACANAASAGSTHCGFSSVNPTCVLASSRPGHTCSPLASSTVSNATSLGPPASPGAICARFPPAHPLARLPRSWMNDSLLN